MTSTLPIFAIDRSLFPSRVGMVETIENHLKRGAIVQIEDGTRKRADRLRYEIRPAEGSVIVFDAKGRTMGVFSDLDALVAHAEKTTVV